MRYPASGQYIDIHTHSRWDDPEIFSIRNLGIKEISQTEVPDENFSAGIHPWFIDEMDVSEAMSYLHKLPGSAAFLAVGECGLDRMKGPGIELQTAVFKEQLKIAENCGKPLLIHCVKAFPQLMETMKANPPSVPWIIHGFNQNLQLASELIRHGAFLSIGRDLLRDNSRIRKSISHLPLENIFLETDEWNQPVSLLYEELASILDLSMDTLKEAIYVNFKKCFIH